MEACRYQLDMSPATGGPNEGTPRIFQYLVDREEGEGGWLDLATETSGAGDEICAEASSFSPFVVRIE